MAFGFVDFVPGMFILPEAQATPTGEFGPPISIELPARRGTSGSNKRAKTYPSFSHQVFISDFHRYQRRFQIP